MDIIIQDEKAHYLYPDGAPELHPAIVVVRDYTGEVGEGWDWDGQVFTEPDHLKIDRLIQETGVWGIPNEEQLAYINALWKIQEDGYPEGYQLPEKPE